MCALFGSIRKLYHAVSWFCFIAARALASNLGTLYLSKGPFPEVFETIAREAQGHDNRSCTTHDFVGSPLTSTLVPLKEFHVCTN
jgi:hypothetical protein